MKDNPCAVVADQPSLATRWCPSCQAMRLTYTTGEDQAEGVPAGSHCCRVCSRVLRQEPDPSLETDPLYGLLRSVERIANGVDGLTQLAVAATSSPVSLTPKAPRREDWAAVHAVAETLEQAGRGKATAGIVDLTTLTRLYQLALEALGRR